MLSDLAICESGHSALTDENSDRTSVRFSFAFCRDYEGYRDVMPTMKTEL